MSAVPSQIKLVETPPKVVADVPHSIQLLGVGIPRIDESIGGFAFDGLTNAGRKVAVRVPKTLASEIVHAFAHLLVDTRQGQPEVAQKRTLMPPASKLEIPEGDLEAAWLDYRAGLEPLPGLAARLDVAVKTLARRFEERWPKEKPICSRVWMRYKLLPRNERSARIASRMQELCPDDDQGKAPLLKPSGTIL